MLSRAAASLYWLGRYVERADFIARLVEATVRLDVLAAAVPGGRGCLALGAGRHRYARNLRGRRAPGSIREAVARFLLSDATNPGSIVRCLAMARDNARAARTALSREAWAAINAAWPGFDRRMSRLDFDATLAIVDAVKAETRGFFEGAIHRMLRNQTTQFIRLGQAVERTDDTARLLDVKYHILLPEGEMVGGTVDRDQWTTILQTVSAVTAYRWLYDDGLRPASVIDLLLSRPELPRSIAASTEETVTALTLLARVERHARGGGPDGAQSPRAGRSRRGPAT
ncbi:alpha-E domain-containing protein [Sphingomonas sp. MMS24-JH45]